MIKITEISEIKAISEPEIRNYIYKKATELMAEYSVDTLNDIGCFVVLDKEETQLFEVAEMEFVDVLVLEKTSYLHGVKILGDSYGEDVYMPVEVTDVMKC